MAASGMESSTPTPVSVGSSYIVQLTQFTSSPCPSVTSSNVAGIQGRAEGNSALEKPPGCDASEGGYELPDSKRGSPGSHGVGPTSSGPSDGATAKASSVEERGSNFQACNECRRKKSKCTGGIPCQKCSLAAIECAYTLKESGTSKAEPQSNTSRGRSNTFRGRTGSELVGQDSNADTKSRTPRSNEKHQTPTMQRLREESPSPLRTLTGPDADKYSILEETEKRRISGWNAGCDIDDLVDLAEEIEQETIDERATFKMNRKIQRDVEDEQRRTRRESEDEQRRLEDEKRRLEDEKRRTQRESEDKQDEQRLQKHLSERVEEWHAKCKKIKRKEKLALERVSELRHKRLRKLTNCGILGEDIKLFDL